MTPSPITTRRCGSTPNFEDAYVNRAMARDDRSDWDGAIADDSAALQLNPKDAYAFNNRGWSSYRKGDTRGGLPTSTRPWRSHPQARPALRDRGVLEREQGDSTAAVADFNRAIDRDAANPDIYVNRALARRDLGDDGRRRGGRRQGHRRSSPTTPTPMSTGPTRGSTAPITMMRADRLRARP